MNFTSRSFSIISRRGSFQQNLARCSFVGSSSVPRDSTAEPSIFRSFSSSADRESMPFDVLIVGGGPSGLASAIRIKQLCQQHNKELSVCLIDKGSEIGSHILSGNVLDPRAITELFDENWKQDLFESQGSHATPVQKDEFLIMNETKSIKIPNFLLPPQLHNEGNYIVSLSQICRWMATKAEELGVEIYSGFSASEVILNQAGAVKGIATRDVGIGKDGQPKSTFEPGMELHARQTLFAEGARGSCSEWIMDHFHLREGKHHQTYGLGLKEVWQVPPEQFQAGLVQHTLGFPLQKGPFDKTFGGSFLYHQEPDLVLVGLVIGLDYENPYINPYKEFQKWKTHPSIKKHLEGGTCISYGARVLNEGGYEAIPKLTFPGGSLIGCSAGFLNAVKIKGTHTAMKSGMLAAEATFQALSEGSSVEETGELDESSALEVVAYEEMVKDSWVGKELYEVRNAHQAFKWGVAGGLAYTGLTTHILKGREPWTLSHDKTDSESTKKASEFIPIDYPAPDGRLTFDLLTNLQRAGTFHEEDQPSHLRIKPELAETPEKLSYPVYGGPEQRFCPAGVYEYVDEGSEKKLVINAQNCIHCKCCSIKMPKEYIDWTVPEGGGGPQYQVM